MSGSGAGRSISDLQIRGTSATPPPQKTACSPSGCTQAWYQNPSRCGDSRVTDWSGSQAHTADCTIAEQLRSSPPGISTLSRPTRDLPIRGDGRSTERRARTTATRHRPARTYRHARARAVPRARDAGSVVQATIRGVVRSRLFVDHMAARLGDCSRGVGLSGACAGDGARGSRRGREAARRRSRVTRRSRAASSPHRL